MKRSKTRTNTHNIWGGFVLVSLCAFAATGGLYLLRQRSRKPTARTPAKVEPKPEPAPLVPPTDPVPSVDEEPGSVAPTSATSPATPPAEVPRRWTSATGEHSVEATLIAIRDGVAFLERRDGMVIKIPVESLSLDDRRALGESLPDESATVFPTVVIPGEDTTRVVGLARSIECKEFAPLEIDFSPNGLLAAAVDGEWLKLFSVVDGVEFAPRRLESNEGGVRRLAFAPHGDKLLVGVRGAVFVYRVDTIGLTLAARFAGHQGDVLCLAWSPDGKAAASGDDQGRLLVWDVESTQELGAHDGGGGFSGCAFRDPSNISFVEQGSLVEWPWRSSRKPRRPLGDSRSGVAAFSPDRSTVLFDSDGPAIHAWDARAHVSLEPLPVASIVRAAPRFFADGRRAAILADGHLEAWSVRPARRLHRAAVPGDGPRALAVSPDNLHVAVGRKDAIDVFRVAPLE